MSGLARTDRGAWTNRKAHLLPVARLPVYADHQDPFDRLLVSQSPAALLILLTVDARLVSYGTDGPGRLSG